MPALRAEVTLLLSRHKLSVLCESQSVPLHATLYTLAGFVWHPLCAGSAIDTLKIQKLLCLHRI